MKSTLWETLNNNFNPGDCLELLYSNSENNVNSLLKYIFNPDTPLTLQISANHSHYSHKLLQNKQFSIKSLLTNYFDILKPITYFGLKKLHKYCEMEEIYIEKIEEMEFDEYIDFVMRERRQFTEILFDFGVKKLNPLFLFEYVDQIRPREYSVSGLDLINQNSEIGTQVLYIYPICYK